VSLTDTAPADAVTGSGRPLAALCLTQVVSWGVVCYAFPVLSGAIALDTGWSAPALAAAFSAALVVSAVLGLLVGRWLDQHGPRALMTTGSVVAAVAMMMVAWSPTLAWFVVAWLLAGVAMSAVLYPPAFAALTRWYGPTRVAALTVLTLAGGLASTIFAPITALLAGQLGWRDTYLVLAAVLAVVTVPAHLIGLKRPWPPAPPVARTDHHAGRVARSRPFLALVVAMALAASASSAVVVNLVPLLTERGMTTTLAAVALGLGGAGQVLGRLGYPQLSRRLGVRTRTVLVLAAVGMTTALLAVLSSAAALVVAAVVAGAVRGILTLLHATAVADRWGVSAYGRLTGLLSAPVTMTAALFPWVGASVAAGLDGFLDMFWLMAGLAIAAAVISLGSVPSGRLPGRSAA
jgi:MFS family permease